MSISHLPSTQFMWPNCSTTFKSCNNFANNNKPNWTRTKKEGRTETMARTIPGDGHWTLITSSNLLFSRFKSTQQAVYTIQQPSWLHQSFSTCRPAPMSTRVDCSSGRVIILNKNKCRRQHITSSSTAKLERDTHNNRTWYQPAILKILSSEEMKWAAVLGRLLIGAWVIGFVACLR